jgi:hypothetical protein
MLATDGSVTQVERILRSETLHSSQALKRLLRFLSDKALSGDADQLKEYTIGLDVFDKPADYDPRKDATVRLHVSRLRQKLADYYRTEGQNDPVLVSLPKGHFKLIWETRTVPTELLRNEQAISQPPAKTRFNATSLALAVALTCSLLIILFLIVQLQKTKVTAEKARDAAAKDFPNWTPELETLWQSFTSNGRPMLVVYNDPIFVAFPGPNGIAAYFRERSLRTWADTARLPEIQALQRALGNPRIEPNFFYVSRGEVQGSFLLGKLFGSRQMQVSLVRLSQLSWEQLSDNNVVLMGPPESLNEKLVGLPVQPQLACEEKGVRNLHPQKGEQTFYADDLTQTHDGQAYAVISQVPGPLGNTGLAIFCSNRSWGDTGAIQFLTDPSFARVAFENLRGPDNKPARYFQILVRVKFRDGVTTDVSYVLHRVLEAKLPVSEQSTK